ncbi:YpuI family protein [Metabacillus arenae]|uniref:YpuI family protein n=1 Tax=Metabacillus arenae TaxID=2771434 RepID=A0A926N7D8_9BACI|nr:YpuI family protein [Metabacillus arenae]MBD1378667.1 YpuI family protein [Metabacillus arenae]
MGNDMVRSQTIQVGDFLNKAVIYLSEYLNEITISSLQTEETGEEKYYKELLSNLRRLTVYCEEGYEACQMILQSTPFRKPAAEKTLYRIYHTCVEEFFNPKHDVWYEDSRSAYTGKNAIKFRAGTPLSLKKLMATLESEFQIIREELEFYETDYRTKMIQSK